MFLYEWSSVLIYCAEGLWNFWCLVQSSHAVLPCFTRVGRSSATCAYLHLAPGTAWAGRADSDREREREKHMHTADVWYILPWYVHTCIHTMYACMCMHAGDSLFFRSTNMCDSNLPTWIVFYKKMFSMFLLSELLIYIYDLCVCACRCMRVNTLQQVRVSVDMFFLLRVQATNTWVSKPLAHICTQRLSKDGSLLGLSNDGC